MPITLISGRLPENSREILVSSKVATDGGVKFAVGDTISLDVGKRMSENEKLGQSDPYTAGSEVLCHRIRKLIQLWVSVESPYLKNLLHQDIP